MKRLILVAMFFAFGVVSSAAETLVSAAKPEDILNVAKGFGSATLGKDDEGDPKISGRIDGTRYTIFFYGCTDEGEKCNDIQIQAAWESSGEYTVIQMNEWNRDKRFGKAYIDDENDPILELDVNLRYGVLERNLDETFDWWVVVLREFKKKVLKK